MISIQNTQFGYNAPILQVESLKIDNGTLTGLIGKNGSGKSTFLKTLCGLTPVLSGSIHIGGKALSHCSEKERSQLVAFVGSSQLAIPYLSVKEFVLLGRSPYTGVLGRYSTADELVADEMLSLFHLDHLRDRELAELSDGERQLAAFARAFAQETPVILMDEPTAFLDYGNKRSLLSVLKNATVESKKCVVISTHDLDLCLEEEISILGINQINKKTIFYPRGTTKEEMITQFF